MQFLNIIAMKKIRIFPQMRQNNKYCYKLNIFYNELKLKLKSTVTAFLFQRKNALQTSTLKFDKNKKKFNVKR